MKRVLVMASSAWLVAWKDGTALNVTMDLRNDRVDVAVADEKVVGVQ